MTEGDARTTVELMPPHGSFRGRTFKPAIGPRYWSALSAAGVLGCNTGDVFADDTGLGDWRGLPILALALAFALTLGGARRATRPSEGWYPVAAAGGRRRRARGIGAGRHRPLSIIALIGIVLLIGIVKKNGMMLVDVAIRLDREERATPLEAIRRASLLHVRPIQMTTVAALLTGVQLMLDTAVGAELRRPLGLATVGGLLVRQALTLYTTPPIYLLLGRCGASTEGQAPRRAGAASTVTRHAQAPRLDGRSRGARGAASMMRAAAVSSPPGEMPVRIDLALHPPTTGRPVHVRRLPHAATR